jgi:cation transport regulator ChaC
MRQIEQAVRQLVQERTIYLLDGQSALVGYGSLLFRPSLERTLGRTYTGPFLACEIRGWRRTWDAALANHSFYADSKDGKVVPDEILYLNACKDPMTVMNGVVFIVNAEELAAYDKRESVYDRVDIGSDINLVIEGGSVYMYVCRPEHRRKNVNSPAKAAVRATYLRMVRDGLCQLGEEFRRVYEASTDEVPAHLVIEDRT